MAVRWDLVLLVSSTSESSEARNLAASARDAVSISLNMVVEVNSGSTFVYFWRHRHGIKLFPVPISCQIRQYLAV